MALGLIAGNSTLEDLQTALADEVPACLGQRVKDLLAQFKEPVSGDTDTAIRTTLEQVAHEKGELLPFAEFADRIESQLAGIVLTAHPTFSLSEAAREETHRLLRAATSEGSDQPVVRGEIRRVHPERSPTLDEELAQSEAALRNIRLAVRKIIALTLDVASGHYPNEWQNLSPNFLTVASWVGFDLDGRTDIGWSKSLLFRYRTAMVGLAMLGDFQRQLAQSDTCGAASFVAQVAEGLETFQACFSMGIEALERGDSYENLGRLNRMAIERRSDKEAAMQRIDSALASLMGMDFPDEFLKQVATFRAEWRSLGLGLSHIHFRLNAAQLHNAIRPQIGLERSPDRSASRRHYLAAISELLDQVEPVNVHYGTLAREQTTAKRLFMLAAQFEKHFDGRTPIRLLVAESDTPFTLLTALYYARLFGVDAHVEISPLFETAIGLQRGDRVIAELLDNPHFLNYIRAQGRFCVQLGFSDSGRYIGQPAATLAIERFKLRLIRLWKVRGLGDIQLLFFDTHGESIGRGAHPASLEDRFLYTHPERVRAELASLDAAHKHEVSFQGGDGYLWFVSEASSLAVLAELLAVRVRGRERQADALYEDSGWSLDFF